jgi:hypothetical protein
MYVTDDRLSANLPRPARTARNVHQRTLATSQVTRAH